jgi:thymidylate kinase
MIEKICIEGIDGAGKTTIANRLAEMLIKDGVKATVVSPHHLANERLGRNTYEMCRDNTQAKLAIQTLKEIFMETEQSTDGVIIYDRHWMTAFTDMGNDPELVEEWGDTFVPAALMMVSPDIASSRIGNDLDEPWSQPAELEKYERRYTELARGNFKHMLGVYRTDADLTVEMIANAIRSDMYYRR